MCEVHQIYDFADIVHRERLSGWKYGFETAIAIAEQLTALEIRNANTAVHHHVEDRLDPLRVAPIEILSLDILQRDACTY